MQNLFREGNMEEKIQDMISNSLQQTIGIELKDREENFITLLNANNKSLIDLLYVFEDLEEKLRLPVSKVLENRSYAVLSVDGLTKAIIEDFGKYRLSSIYKEGGKGNEEIK